ncbi:MAG: hypothetical protein Ct9H90mP15_04490 [Candidatus Neomarinimicrobiota bacterium]|nr:MAG: hypothetical protein Ct9H90mP15_04490 [Candidatus Neomarinimicrobiota bacterium]
MNYKSIENFSQWSEEEKNHFTVNVIKGLVIDGVRKANSGHPGDQCHLLIFHIFYIPNF